MRYLRQIVLLPLIVACGSTPSSRDDVIVRDSGGIHIREMSADQPPGPASRWQWVQDLSFATDRDFGEIADVGVTDGGSVVVLDRFEAAVVILDSTGTELRRFGAPGEGPGEFRPEGLSSVVVRGDTILVPDLLLQRATAFLLDGTVLGTVRVPVDGGLAMDWGTDPQRSYVFRWSSVEHEVFARGDLLGAVDTLLMLSTEGAGSQPLGALPVWQMLRDGRLLIGWTNAFEVARYPVGRMAEPDLIIRWLGQAAALTEGDRGHLIDLMRESMQQGAGGSVPIDRVNALLDQVEFPSTVPAIGGLRVGPDGTWWVQRARSVAEMDRAALRVGSTKGYGSAIWEVFEAEGEYVGQVNLPAGFRLTRIVGSYIYGVAVDALGVQTVQRLELVSH